MPENWSARLARKGIVAVVDEEKPCELYLKSISMITGINWSFFLLDGLSHHSNQAWVSMGRSRTDTPACLLPGSDWHEQFA